MVKEPQTKYGSSICKESILGLFHASRDRIEGRNLKKKKERDYIFLNRFKMLTNTTISNGYY